jgi:hypothetical protein
LLEIRLLFRWSSRGSDFGVVKPFAAHVFRYDAGHIRNLPEERKERATNTCGQVERSIRLGGQIDVLKHACLPDEFADGVARVESFGDTLSVDTQVRPQ